MAWKKVIVSGSNAELANLTATGTDIKLTNLPTGSSENVVLVDSSTGAIKRIAMSSVTGANTTYSINSSTSGDNANINITGSDGSTDTVTLAAGNNVTITQATDTITIASTNDYVHPTQSTITVDQTALQTIDGISVNSLGHVTAITSQAIQTATTGQVGVVQLSDATGSTSTSLAATANAVSGAYAAAATAQAAADAVSGLSAAEITQLGNIDSVTISNTQWGYLGAADQAINQAASPTFAGVTSGGTISGSTVNAVSASFNDLTVTGSATMTGALTFNGVNFTETAIGTITGSNTFGTNGGGNAQTFYGNSAFNDGNVTISGSLILTNNDLAVQYGGTGLSTVTTGHVLLGNGTSPLSTLDATADSTFLVGNGATMVAESGATLRTSIGVGTGDTPQFTGLDLGGTDATLTRNSAGDLNIEGNIIYRAGGTTVPITDGGTGLSTLPTGLLVGAGTGTITAKTIGIANDNIVEIDDADAANGDYAKFTDNGLEGRDASEVRTDLGLGTIYSSDVATTSSQISNNTASNAAIPTAGQIYEYIAAQNYGIGTGDITSITAGNGLTGSSLSSGDAILNVVGGNGITANADDIALDADLTTVTSIRNNSLVVGSATGQDQINFGSPGNVKIQTNNVDRVTVDDNGVTIANKLTVSGDLQVDGTTTTVNSTVVEIDDAFISLGANAAAANIDSGIIFGARDSGGTTVQGDSLFWDGDYSGNDGRLAIDHGVAVGATTATAEYYLAGVIEGDATAATNALANHKGNIRIDGGEIYIYAT